MSGPSEMIDPIEARRLFYEDARRAWKDYRETGLHLTEAEVEPWLERLIAGEDVDPPPCHR